LLIPQSKGSFKQMCFERLCICPPTSWRYGNCIVLYIV